ncbi:MAG: hypothetical protein U1F35_22700 [Steroidobacteraceae bacterium]
MHVILARVHELHRRGGGLRGLYRGDDEVLREAAAEATAQQRS